MDSELIIKVNSVSRLSVIKGKCIHTCNLIQIQVHTYKLHIRYIILGDLRLYKIYYSVYGIIESATDDFSKYQNMHVLMYTYVGIVHITYYNLNITNVTGLPFSRHITTCESQQTMAITIQYFDYSLDSYTYIYHLSSLILQDCT